MEEEVVSQEESLLTGGEEEATETVDTPNPETPNKGEEENKEEGADKEKPKEGAPESYEDFTLPENFVVDDEFLGSAKEAFKELNLSQDQAQKLVDLQAQYAQQAAEAQVTQWQETIDGWRDEAKNDKEIGGADHEAKVAVAKAAIKEFASDEFKEMLNFTGVGNHPEMVRFLHRVGKAISDDKVFHGARTSQAKDPAKVMFPDMS